MNNLLQSFAVVNIVLGVISLMVAFFWGLSEVDEGDSGPIKAFLITITGSLLLTSGIIFSYLVK